MDDPLTTTDNDWRFEVALFRYSLIADIVPLSPGEGMYRQIEEKALREYAIPGTTRTRVAPETLRDWLQLYRRGGFKALLPKQRADAGKFRLLSEAVIHTLKAQYLEHPEWPITRHYSELAAQACTDSNLRPVPSYGTISRYMKAEGLRRKQHARRDEKWLIQSLQPSDRQTLELWRKSKEKALWERAVAILENGKLDAQQIATKIERPVFVVHGWIKAFKKSGITGIWPTRKKRAPDRRTYEQDENTKRILAILHDRPSSFGVNRSNWSLSSLASTYEAEFHKPISKSTVSRLLRKAGYGLKKARKVLTSPDPNYREKVDLVLRTLQNLQPRELFFFVDEMGPLRVRKYGGRTYSKGAQVHSYPQSQPNKGSVTLAGALSATSNQVTWFYSNSKDTSAMIDLIELLFNQYHESPKLYITWDAASWHDSITLNDWLDDFNHTTRCLASGPLIYLAPLPTSSQFLDVIEAIFSGMKRAVIHHSDYRSAAEMKAAIAGHFRDRNQFFRDNPKRVGKKIWEQEFFSDPESFPSGNYREW